MENLLLLCILVVVVVRWIYLRERLNHIEERIEELHRQVLRPPVMPAAGPLASPEPPAHPSPPPPPAAPPAPAKPPVPPPVAVPPPLIAAAPPPAHADWEATVGGNWLNKAGVIVLVIGLALALAYSFAHIGPVGRVGVSLAVSLAMLVAGAVFEPRERYRVFARGLLGGGWAGLYTTVYAMHAVKEALVIPNAVAGTLLLIAVAIGMIVHSLRYQSQTVTGLAYFIAFGTLAITEVNMLAAVALVPLAASLLYIAHRFAWSRMAMFGLIATYAVVVFRGDSGATLAAAQALFAIFWLVFESYDILHPEAWLLPLNATGFLGLSLLKWNASAPASVWMLLAATAIAYLASTVARWRSARWQGAATVASGVAAAAIFQKFGRQWVASALLIEAELVYLAGVRLRARYLRWLGTALFAAQAGRLLLWDMHTLPTHTWTAVALVDAVAFYANRALEAADLFYGYLAAAMLALVIGYEAPERSRSVAWLTFAAGSIGFGWARRLFDFRMHGYLLGILGLTAVGMEAPTNLPALWGALAFSYGVALCARYFPEPEQEIACYAASLAATLSAVLIVWRLFEHVEYLGLAWMALALLLLELGLRKLPAEFRTHSVAVAALGAAWVAAANLLPLSKTRPLIPMAAAALAYAFAVRAWSSRQRVVYAAAFAAGTVFLLYGLWAASPESAAAPLWAVVSLALTGAALASKDSVILIYAYVVAALAFLRCWGFNFAEHRQSVVAAAVAAACFFAAHLLSPRGRFARVYDSLLGTSLITLMLGYESSGSLLTVAWGVQGVALLVSGFPLRDRVLRLSGLALLMSCILKLFLWDLRHLETLPRIFSFIVLGLFLVGVSWIYTRFREHVERYL